MTRPTRITDLTVAFPAHDICVDAELRGPDAWATLAAAQTALRAFPHDVIALTWRSAGTLALRLRVETAQTADQLRASLHSNRILDIAHWSVTIGRPRDPATCTERPSTVIPFAPNSGC